MDDEMKENDVVVSLQAFIPGLGYAVFAAEAVVDKDNDNENLVSRNCTNLSILLAHNLRNIRMVS